MTEMPTRNLEWGRDPVSGKLDSRYDASGNLKVRLLGRANFTDNSITPATLISGFTWGADSDGSMVIESGALRMNYPSMRGAPFYDGGIYNYLNFNLPTGHGIKELYMKFDAKMPNVKHGLKFCKVFGRRSSTNYANTTFAIDYTGQDNGAFRYIGFGDGSTIENDTGNMFYLSGGGNLGRAPSPVVTTGGGVFPSTEWGTGWHTFRLKVKFNDGTTAGNEVPNGELLVNIDGVDRVKVTGIFNRHYSNQEIEYISFGDWSQTSGVDVPAFDIHYDNIFISANGFYEGS